jgi:hypothetical protein
VYPVDQDRVVPLGDIPQSSVGAPLPRIVADEHTCLVGFYLQERDPAWDGTYARIIEPEATEEPVGIVTFPLYDAMMFGPPNDEAFSGHPLAGRGLEPYGAFDVLHSSWILQLERMSSVHRQHRRERFVELRHFILSFHDSTFECVAPRYEVTVRPGPLARVSEWMHEQLRR